MIARKSLTDLNEATCLGSIRNGVQPGDRVLGRLREDMDAGQLQSAE